VSGDLVTLSYRDCCAHWWAMRVAAGDTLDYAIETAR
jgi:hypothetical protein